MARATISLPQPVSPVISTDTSQQATRRALSRTWSMAWLTITAGIPKKQCWYSAATPSLSTQFGGFLMPPNCVDKDGVAAVRWFPDAYRMTAKVPIENPGRIVIGKYSIPWKAKLLVGAVVSSGLFCFAYAVSGWRCNDPRQYLFCLAIALLASVFKVHLPGVTGTISVSYAFILLSMVQFSYGETMVLACVAMAMQTG